MLEAIHLSALSPAVKQQIADIVAPHISRETPERVTSGDVQKDVDKTCLSTISPPVRSPSQFLLLKRPGFVRAQPPTQYFYFLAGSIFVVAQYRVLRPSRHIGTAVSQSCSSPLGAAAIITFVISQLIAISPLRAPRSNSQSLPAGEAAMAKDVLLIQEAHRVNSSNPGIRLVNPHPCGCGVFFQFGRFLLEKKRLRQRRPQTHDL